MAEIISLPTGEQEDEQPAMICEVCSENWDLLSAHFFVHADGSFRCVRCATAYIFTNSINGQKK